MKTKIKNKVLLLLTSVFLITMLMATLCQTFLPANAETTDFMIFDQGAMIRIDTENEESQTTTGIRFAVNVDSSIYDKEEIGMIIVPSFVLDAYNAQTTETDYFKFIQETYGKDKATVSTSLQNASEYLSGTGGVFYGVIARILDANYNNEYGAVAYYKDGESYHYYPCDFTRRIGDVANSAIQDTAKGYEDDEITALKNIVNKAIKLSNDNAETLSVNLAVGKTVDLGQVITDNFISANKNAIKWEVTEGSDHVKLGFLDNIQGISAGTSKLKATAYDGKLELEVTVNVSNATTAEDVVDYVVDVASGKEIKVLQLTDTQITDSTQDENNVFGTVELGGKYIYKPEHMEENLFKYMRKAVKDATPDLIILTGDLVYGQFDNDGSCFSALVKEMDSYKIPWAAVYGNHDNESAKGAIWQNEQLKKSKYCLFNQGVADGNGNYSIGIKQDGEIKRVFYLMDSNYCGAASNASANNVKTTVGFSDSQMEWLNLSVSELRRVNANVPISMAYHVPDVNFQEANKLYMNNTTNGTKYYTIGANVAAQNGDFGSNENKDGAVADVEVFNVTYNEKSLLALYKEYGVDSVFVGHYHTLSMSILYEDIRWTFGLKTGVYDSQTTKNMGGTLATISSDGGISVKHLYYDNDYAAQRDALLSANVSNTLSGISVGGTSLGIDHVSGITQKTNPISIEYVKDSDGNSSVAYRLTGSHHTDATQFVLDSSLYEGCESVTFKVLFKSGEITKEVGGTRQKDGNDNFVYSEGKYVVSKFSVLYVWRGEAKPVMFKEKDVDTNVTSSMSQIVEYTMDTWNEITVPLVWNGVEATYFGFILSSYSTIYLKDISVNEPAFTLAEEDDIIKKYQGDTYQLTATGVGLTYSSSNETVATVDDTGLIFCGKTVGEVTITVKDKHGNEKTVIIKVSEKPQYVNYTTSVYMQMANGIYDVVEYNTTHSTKPGCEVSIIPEEKTGYTVNSAKSVLSATVNVDGSTELCVYYDITGMTYNQFVVSTGTTGMGANTQYTANGNGSVSFKGDAKTYFTHDTCEYIVFNRELNKNYLLVTVEYNEGTDTTQDWRVSLAFGGASNTAMMAHVTDVYVLDDNGKFVKHSSDKIVTGAIVTYVLDFSNVSWIDGNTITDVYDSSTFESWKIRFNYERKVDLVIYNYAFMTTEQANGFFTTGE